MQQYAGIQYAGHIFQQAQYCGAIPPKGGQAGNFRNSQNHPNIGISDLHISIEFISKSTKIWHLNWSPNICQFHKLAPLFLTIPGHHISAQISSEFMPKYECQFHFLSLNNLESVCLVVELKLCVTWKMPNSFWRTLAPQILDLVAE
jgi:hypothetical protein